MRVMIIGGGVIGLSCAWHLAQKHAAVTLFEARRCGQGASHAALGALWPPSPLATGPLQSWHRQCLHNYPEFLRQLAAASRLSVAYRRLGRVEILQSAAAADRAAVEAQASARTMEVIAPPAVAAFAGGAAAPFGGLLCRDTAQVDVAQLIAALHAACLAAGVEILEHTEARLYHAGDQLRGVETAAGRRDADALLLAAGAWSGTLAPLPGVRPAKGQGIALALPAAAQPRGIVKRGPIYIVPWPERNEVLVGSTTEPAAGFAEEPTADARAMLATAAADLLPALHGTTLLRHWAGLRPDGPRHRPIMAQAPDTPGLWLCTGHYKTGIGTCGDTGRRMARAILHGEELPRWG